jgi:hypothetical protein
MSTSTTYRPKLLLESQRFGARRRNPDDRHAFTLEQQARDVEERLVVIDDETANLHLDRSCATRAPVPSGHDSRSWPAKTDLGQVRQSRRVQLG